MKNAKVGDTIKLLDENRTGTILSIQNETVTIQNEFGFEEVCAKSKVLLMELKIAFDLPNEQAKEIFFTPDDSNLKAIKQEKKEIIEVDLHIGHLVDHLKGLTPHQMLQIQIKKIKEILVIAKKDKIKTIIFIHGKGKGILKNELNEILDKKNDELIYFDANFQKYKMGATEVRFY